MVVFATVQCVQCVCDHLWLLWSRQCSSYMFVWAIMCRGELLFVGCCYVWVAATCLGCSTCVDCMYVCGLGVGSVLRTKLR